MKVADPVDFSMFSEEEFIKFALDSLKFNIRDHKEQGILQKTRLIKFVVLLAQKVGYTGLTYGWYRNGYYCQKAFEILSDKNVLSLEDYVSENIKSTDKQKKIIDMTINEFKGIFLGATEKFYDWVYRVISPKEYRKLYSTYYKFTLDLNHLSKDIQRLNIDDNYLTKIENDITDYYTQMNHVKDEEVYQAFCDFTDILEGLFISLRYNKNKEKIAIYIKELTSLHDILYSFLTPYKETLTGPNREAILNNFTNSKNKEVLALRKKFEELESNLRKEQLWPSHEEMMEYTKKLCSNLKPEEIKEIEKALLS